MLLDVLTRGRAREESTMLDTYNAFRPDGTETVGGLVRDKLTPIGTTIGKTGGNTATGQDAVTRTVNIGDVPTLIILGGLSIPVGSARPEVDWEYQCTASASDPTNVGRRWKVQNVPGTTIATARRLDVYEVEVPTP